MKLTVSGIIGTINYLARSGFYWVFTIIITACYTSSIIAFVTLPVFPETVDTIRDLLSGFYRIGTLCELNLMIMQIVYKN